MTPTERDDTALVRYLERWDRRIRALQRRQPGRFQVRGWSEQEVRDALTLRLFEIARAEAATDSHREVDWELTELDRALRELQRGSRLHVTVMDLSEAPLLQREPSQEEHFLELEGDAQRTLAEERARARLNQPQLRWLAAMQWSARCGEFFETSDRLNLSAASRVLGKNRSSAARAYRELQSHFQDALARLE
jgi:hypothetical protein